MWINGRNRLRTKQSERKLNMMPFLTGQKLRRIKLTTIPLSKLKRINRSYNLKSLGASQKQVDDFVTEKIKKNLNYMNILRKSMES